MRNRPIKIAIYSGEIPSTTFIERLIRGLADEGSEILLFGVLKKKCSYPATVTVVSYTHHRLVKLLHYLKFSILLFLYKRHDKRKLDGFLKRYSKSTLYSKVKFYPVLWHHPDIFHVQWAKGLEEWTWVQEFGMKLVLSLRGAHINYSPIADHELASMYRSYFPKVDGFHAVSKAIAVEATRYGAALEKIKVVYSGLNLRQFHYSPARHNSNIKIISVGRPHWKKGYSYALDACKLLKDSNLDFEYTIVGAETDIELLYQIFDLGLTQHVKLGSQKDFETVKALIQVADVLLLPSIEEGVANVVLEAMALGTLVLSTDCGGMNEVITQGVNGFLVPIRNPKAIADAVLHISKMPLENRIPILEAALQTIKERHSEERMVEGMRSFYELTIDN